MPFTENEFLDVFAAFNAAFWPVLALLAVAAAWFAGQIIGGHSVPRAARVFLAILWAWTGIAYHALYFATINPAAWIFAVAFVAQAVAFLWWARQRDTQSPDPARPCLTAILFLAFALLYPGLVVLSGHAWPRAPIFGVPCPVVIFTAGVLLAAGPSLPRGLFVIPILWALIGGSAAFLFDMTPDLMLFVAAAVLAGRALRPLVRSVGLQAHAARSKGL